MFNKKMKEPTVEISAFGTKRYYVDGKLHREDGPAVESSDGTKYWYRHDLLHREDGPAIEGSSGSKLWWYQDQYIRCSSQEEFEKHLKLKAFW